MGKKIKEDLAGLISEHKHLMSVLTSPTKAKLAAEAKKQGKELSEYLKLK